MRLIQTFPTKTIVCSSHCDHPCQLGCLYATAMLCSQLVLHSMYTAMMTSAGLQHPTLASCRSRYAMLGHAEELASRRVWGSDSGRRRCIWPTPLSDFSFLLNCVVSIRFSTNVLLTTATVSRRFHSHNRQQSHRNPTLLPLPPSEDKLLRLAKPRINKVSDLPVASTVRREPLFGRLSSGFLHRRNADCKSRISA